MSHPPLGLTARAFVSRVVDGDTIDVVVQWPVRIRLKDCWAPELRSGDLGGFLAKERMEQLAPAGSQVVFHVDSSNADALGDLLTFGRIVAQVWRPGDDESLSEIMVGVGLATAEKQT